MRKVVHSYFQAYQQHRDELPAKARDIAWRDKMELAYPFHPDVIDTLSEKWSTFSSFQRTRGVLRILANVVEELYRREANLDLILPGDLNLGHPPVRQEFLRHTGPEFEGVIGSDIAGHEAKAPALDDENRAWHHLAQRIATATFFHSFTADGSGAVPDTAARGATLPYLKLAMMRSDTIPAMVTEVLQRLANSLWYLNAESDRYYFSRIPNLNRMALDKKELHNQSYETRMRHIIEGELGSRMSTYLWPTTGDGIPDNHAIKLVVMHPEAGEGEINAWLARKGTTFREYANTLIFALADTGAFAKLKEDVKTVLALEEIEDEIKRGVSPLPEDRRSEVQRRTQAVTRDFSYNVRRMYHQLRVASPDGLREIDLGTPVAGKETLTGWYWRELASMDHGVIVEQLHYRMLANRLLSNADEVAASVVLDQFYKNPLLPLPAPEGVVARAIQLGVQDGALGLADRVDGDIDLDTLRFAESLPLDAVDFSPQQIVLAKSRAEALQAQRLAARSAADAAAQTPSQAGADAVTGFAAAPTSPDVNAARRGTPAGGSVSGISRVSGVSDSTAAPPDEVHHRLRLVIADVPANRIADVNRGIFVPLSNLADGGLTVTLELDVTSDEGIPARTLEQTIKETVRQIGARIVAEETD